MANERHDIGTGLIKPSRTNPRTVFDDARMKELQESIKAKGIVRPLVVRSIGDGSYELIAGERRLRAAKAIGLATVPAYIEPMNDEEVVEYQLLEFVQSEGITPLEEAETFQRYVKNKKGTVDVAEIAAKFGKTRRYVAERVQLNKLTKEFKDLLGKGKMTLAAALQIAKLHPDAQQQLFATTKRRRYLLEEGREDDLKEELEQSFLLQLAKAPFDQADEKLFPKAGACLNCPKRSDVNQDLFGETKAGVLCLDAVCFHKKVDNFIAQKQQEYEDKDLKLIRITLDSYPDRTVNAIGSEKYHVVAKAAGQKKFGIFVEQGYHTKFGEIVPIQLYSEEKEERAPGEKPSMARRVVLYRRRMEIFGNRIEFVVRQRLLKEILQAVKKVTKEDLKIVLEWAMEGQMHYSEDWIEEAMGVKEIRLDALNEHQLVRVALGMVLTGEEMQEDPTMNCPDDERFRELVKRYRINRTAITKEVAKEFEPKRPRKPVAEKVEKKQVKVKKSKAGRPKSGVCRICGCTEDNACKPNGCSSQPGEILEGVNDRGEAGATAAICEGEAGKHGYCSQ